MYRILVDQTNFSKTLLYKRRNPTKLENYFNNFHKNFKNTKIAHQIQNLHKYFLNFSIDVHINAHVCMLERSKIGFFASLHVRYTQISYTYIFNYPPPPSKKNYNIEKVILKSLILKVTSWQSWAESTYLSRKLSTVCYSVDKSDLVGMYCSSRVEVFE